MRRWVWKGLGNFSARGKQCAVFGGQSSRGRTYAVATTEDTEDEDLFASLAAMTEPEPQGAPQKTYGKTANVEKRTTRGSVTRELRDQQQRDRERQQLAGFTYVKPHLDAPRPKGYYDDMDYTTYDESTIPPFLGSSDDEDFEVKRVKADRPPSAYRPTKSRDWVNKEKRYDYIPLKDTIWPEIPPEPINFRTHIPLDDPDETFGVERNVNFNIEIQMDAEVVQPKELEGNKPIRPPKINKFGVARGIGKRKRAIAAAYLSSVDRHSLEGARVTINGRRFYEYFPVINSRIKVIAPLTETQTLGAYNVRINIRGGGFKGQSEACTLAVARALVNMNPDHYEYLRRCGFLTRDSRIVETKKAGKLGARKKKPWSKR